MASLSCSLYPIYDRERIILQPTQRKIIHHHDPSTREYPNQRGHMEPNFPASPDSSAGFGFVPAALSPSVPWPKFLSQSTSRFSLAPAWLDLWLHPADHWHAVLESHLCDFDVQLRWIPDISRGNENQKPACLRLAFSFSKHIHLSLLWMSSFQVLAPNPLNLSRSQGALAFSPWEQGTCGSWNAELAPARSPCNDLGSYPNTTRPLLNSKYSLHCRPFFSEFPNASSAPPCGPPLLPSPRATRLPTTPPRPTWASPPSRPSRLSWASRPSRASRAPSRGALGSERWLWLPALRRSKSLVRSQVMPEVWMLWEAQLVFQALEKSGE